jgi:protoporphyrin/coproporphyrin ferrochelatase
VTSAYDAILLTSFGGPEGPEDVLPFLRNVTAGKDIPDERLEEVGEHYHGFGGRSPINDHNRTLRAALQDLFSREGPDLPVYWGNRFWHPMLADTLRQMRDDGIQHALCVVTSAYSSYSGCRAYREDLATARAEVGDGAPQLDKVRVFYNHPGFVQPQAALVAAAIERLPAEQRDDARIVFVTHSIPLTMSRHSDYEAQHHEACRLVVDALDERGCRPAGTWDLVYCSRSGPPSVPWLTPDVNDHLEALHGADVPAVVVVPVGFVSDHMEVVYDLDVEAAATAERLGMGYVRASTVGADPGFVAAIRELVLERLEGVPALSLGTRGPNWDVCPSDCCLTPGQAERPTIAAAPARRGRG